VKTKSEIRKEIRKKLENQSEAERQERSLTIKKRLFSLPEFKNAKMIMFYVSTEREVDTHGMIDDALRMGKKIAVPYVIKDEGRMTPSLIKNRTEDLQEGSYGIPEPKKDSLEAVSKEELDMVVVPGVAFTAGGARLGRGGGFYDKFLKDLRQSTHTVGVAFGMQVVQELPKHEHDIPVGRIITEQSHKED